MTTGSHQKMKMHNVIAPIISVHPQRLWGMHAGHNAYSLLVMQRRLDNLTYEGLSV